MLLQDSSRVIAALDGLLEAIRDLIEDMPAPSETTNWGHVGDMNRIVTLLRPILFPGEDHD